MNAMFGAGFKLSIVEIGAALQIQARLSQPIVGDIGTATGIGSSAATIAPYLRLSPPQIPASIFIKGAVLEEYTEFGYALGGSNSPKPKVRLHGRPLVRLRLIGACADRPEGTARHVPGGPFPFPPTSRRPVRIAVFLLVTSAALGACALTRGPLTAAERLVRDSAASRCRPDARCPSRRCGGAL